MTLLRSLVITQISKPILILRFFLFSSFFKKKIKQGFATQSKSMDSSKTTPNKPSSSTMTENKYTIQNQIDELNNNNNLEISCHLSSSKLYPLKIDHNSDINESIEPDSTMDNQKSP